MITKAELKYYLKLDDTGLEAAQITDRDEFLNTSIQFAISELDSALNRKLESTEHIEKINSNVSDIIVFTKNRPVTAVTSLKYWSGDQYSDVIISPDTINDTIEIYESYIRIRKGYSVYQKELKIEYTAGYKFEVLTGTLAGTIGTATITGSGTDFDGELSIGDEIIIEGELKKVAGISGNTSLTLDSVLSKTYSGSLGYLNSYPSDLRKAVCQMAAYHFLESRQGESSLNKSGSSINLGGSAGETYKKLDLSGIINQYRNINI